jgi:hypothetical protein
MSDLFDTPYSTYTRPTRSYGIVRYMLAETTHTERCPTRGFYESMARMANRYGHSVVAVRLVTERPSSPLPRPRRRKPAPARPGVAPPVDLAAYRSAKAVQAQMRGEEHAAD